ncbi:MAG: hypothetical protein F6J90_34900 [Moorea sp. SIOASIH]|uniref:hypothetical protein n=1 Tax=Moorena sp. SIOASIH TaxID=2607817 RepID=UPI0013BD4FD3|nr:hypothetical protein [Moorena sp. SIOASIH]NEO41239.1 hypothetical protein [Moorena sp. SIOASIH]
MIGVYNYIKPKLIDHNTKNCALFPTILCSLLPIPYSLFPIPCSFYVYISNENAIWSEDCYP